MHKPQYLVPRSVNSDIRNIFRVVLGIDSNTIFRIVFCDVFRFAFNLISITEFGIVVSISLNINFVRLVFRIDFLIVFGMVLAGLSYCLSHWHSH